MNNLIAILISIVFLLSAIILRILRKNPRGKYQTNLYDLKNDEYEVLAAVPVRRGRRLAKDTKEQWLSSRREWLIILKKDRNDIGTYYRVKLDSVNFRKQSRKMTLKIVRYNRRIIPTLIINPNHFLKPE